MATLNIPKAALRRVLKAVLDSTAFDSESQLEETVEEIKAALKRTGPSDTDLLDTMDQKLSEDDFQSRWMKLETEDPRGGIEVNIYPDPPMTFSTFRDALCYVHEKEAPYYRMKAREARKAR
jgi:hypothetical protein